MWMAEGGRSNQWTPNTGIFLKRHENNPIFLSHLSQKDVNFFCRGNQPLQQIRVTSPEDCTKSPADDNANLHLGRYRNSAAKCVLSASCKEATVSTQHHEEVGHIAEQRKNLSLDDALRMKWIAKVLESWGDLSCEKSVVKNSRTLQSYPSHDKSSDCLKSILIWLLQREKEQWTTCFQVVMTGNHSRWGTY